MHPSLDQPEPTAAPVPASAGGQPQPQPRPAAATDEVDTLLAGLDTLDGRPLAEHVEVFEQVHGRLQAALREIDNA